MSNSLEKNPHANANPIILMAAGGDMQNSIASKINSIASSVAYLKG